MKEVIITTNLITTFLCIYKEQLKIVLEINLVINLKIFPYDGTKVINSELILKRHMRNGLSYIKISNLNKWKSIQSETTQLK